MARTEEVKSYTDPRNLARHLGDAAKGRTREEMIEMRKKADGVPRMTVRECVAISKRICNLYATGKYTLEFCCKHFNIKPTKFRKWTRPEADIEQMILDEVPLPVGFIMNVREMYMEARKRNHNVYIEDLKDSARIGLRKKVEGFTSEETIVEYAVDTNTTIYDEESESDIRNPNFGKMVPVKHKIKTYETAPDTSAVIFALVNTDPENFKHRNHVDHGGRVDLGSNGLDALSDSELTQKKKELELHIATLNSTREL